MKAPWSLGRLFPAAFRASQSISMAQQRWRAVDGTWHQSWHFLNISLLKNLRWDREKPNPKAQLFYFTPVLTEYIAIDVNAMCHHMFLMARAD